MMRDGNGRFRPPDGSHGPRDPGDEFPFRHDFCDCCGQRRWFVMALQPVELGYAVSATEEGKDDDGYYFREFDPHSPYLALGRLRGRIQRALATRHLEERMPGDFLPLHDTLRGRISYSSAEDQVTFVIDGKALTLPQFAKIVEMYEGWQFHLDFLDPSEDVR